MSDAQDVDGQTRTHTLTVRDYLRAVQAGHAPPPASALLLGVAIVDVADGTATFSLRPRSDLDNGGGMVHGGFLASLADFAAASSINDVLVTDLVVTAQLSMTYTEAVPLTAGEIRARGQVLHRRARTAAVSVTLTGEDGRVHAVGTATCVVSKASLDGHAGTSDGSG